MNFPLSDEDRVLLKKLHKTEKNKKMADRIKATLLFDKGYSQRQISEILLIDEDTVSNWFKRFKISRNISGFLGDDYMAYEGKLTSGQSEQIKKYINENIITDSKQLIDYIKEQFGIVYSISGVQYLIRALGFTYKQLTLFPSKADIEQQRQFEKQYRVLRKNLRDKEVLLFLDGVHPQHNTRASKAWILAGTEKYIKTNTGRNRLNLNGVYNPENQEVIIREDEAINAESNIRLFEAVKEHYKDAKCIYVIADNARYNRSKQLMEYLKNSKIKMIYLPAYSPNLNLIERLWKFMRKKIINTTYYADFETFKKTILNFFNNIGQYKNELKRFIGTKLRLLNPILVPKTTLG
jgi:transposase